MEKVNGFDLAGLCHYFLNCGCGYVAMKQNMVDAIEIVFVILFGDLQIHYIASAIQNHGCSLILSRWRSKSTCGDMTKDGDRFPSRVVCLQAF